MEAQRTVIFRFTKRQQKLLGHVKRKEVLENLIFTGHIERKRDMGRQKAIYLMDDGMRVKDLTKGQKLLKSTRG